MARKTKSADPFAQQKALAQRVDHQYFERPHPWRARMRLLSLIAPLTGVTWLTLALFSSRSEAVFLPGPVSRQHNQFGNRCGECHEQKHGQWGAVLDSKCLACHDGPIHEFNSVDPGGHVQIQIVKGKEVPVSTPGCASCHAEHKGRAVLGQMEDGRCVQCHGDLRLKDGTSPPIKRDVTALDGSHPEWRVLREKQIDNTPYRLNHSVHVDPSIWPGDLAAAAKSKVVLLCVQCHQLDNSGKYFKPISYDAHCASCHKMEGIAPAVDPIGKVKFPHGEAEVVAAEIKRDVAQYLVQHGGHPSLIREPAEAKPAEDEDDEAKSRAAKPAKVDTRTAAQWVADYYGQIIQPLFFPKDLKEEKRSCLLCHITSGIDEAGLVKISTQKIPPVWLTQSTFNHDAHRVLNCTACHTQATASKVTTDVLLPGVESCRGCHSPRGGARAGCVECHLFHDRALMNFQGQRSIAGFQHGPSAPPPPPPPPLDESIIAKLNSQETTRLQGLNALWLNWQAQEKKKLDGAAQGGQPVSIITSPPAATVPPPAVVEKHAAPPEIPVPATWPPTGAPASVVCPICGKSWPGYANFCGRCGIRLLPDAKK